MIWCKKEKHKKHSRNTVESIEQKDYELEETLSKFSKIVTLTSAY